jgi:hypothetical protein
VDDIDPGNIDEGVIAAGVGGTVCAGIVGACVFDAGAGAAAAAGPDGFACASVAGAVPEVGAGLAPAAKRSAATATAVRLRKHHRTETPPFPWRARSYRPPKP